MNTRLFILFLSYSIPYIVTSLAAHPVWGQTSYYVASNGNDSNDGRSVASPFQNLSKINGLSLQAGDMVLFRRGDTFRGTLQLSQSGASNNPIVIDAYGSGNKPILSGAAIVTSWSNIGNNIWQANCPTCGSQVTGLYRDNTALPLGRYPNLDATNKGYLTVQSHSGKTQLTSQQSLSTNWTGGEAVFRPTQWILNRAKITGQNGNTLILEGSGNYDISDNWGYFIQNHPSTLDQNGEWSYNPTNKTIQLYTSQDNPNNLTIAATAFAQAINLANASYVTIRNLQITQTLNTGVLVTNSSNITIINNDITQSGEDGVSIQGSGQQVLLEGNLVENVNNNGVAISTYQNVTFRGNTVRNVGLLPGRGKSGDGTYVGFQSASTANTLIENNVLDNIGYHALNFSTNTTVQHNQISNFCLTKSDGGGLYIWNGNHQDLGNIHLLSNTVYNGIGAPEGSPSGTSAGAHGIYLDDCTANIEVKNNTVYNCNGSGLFLHGSSSITVTGNTSYNNSEAQISIKSANSCQPRSNVILNNIFVSRSTDQYNAKYESSQNDLSSYGQLDNNVYARPFDDNLKILIVNNTTNGTALSLSQWQSQYGKDQSSSNSPITYTSGNPDGYIKFLSNPTANDSQVMLDGNFRNARNTVYTNQVTIPAFSSLLLLKDIIPVVTLRTPENPANAVTGLDYSYYENYWTSLPDFTTLTPVKTGTTNTPGLSVRNQDQNYGLRFTGYISVPTDGTYTFYTNSDDGSKLLIGTTEVVNNDGGHGEQERSGPIGLKAGVHALTVVYFQGGGGQALSVSYSGPSINKQVIPDASFQRVATTPVVTLRTPENPANAVTGLDYSYYENYWTSLPDFTTLTPVKTGTTNTPGLSVRNQDQNYGLRFTGYISVPTDGTYTFYTNSDDGSKLLIGTTEVVNNDGGHGEQERSGPIGLKAGVHALTVVYFQGGGGQALSVSYSGPSINKQVIPDASFRRVASSGGEPPVSDQKPNVRAYSATKDSPKASQITTRLELRNDGTTSVAVQDLSVRYWFTSDNSQLAKVYVDYAAMGGDNVQPKVVQISPVAGADSYVELKMAPSTLSIAPMSSLGAIDFRLVRSDYGLLDQTNDYSYLDNYGAVALNPHFCVYLKGVLIYGSAPAGASARMGAIEESPSRLQVRVLGNPVLGASAEVEISGVSGQRVVVEVVDIQGRRWHQQTLPQASSEDRLSVPLGTSQGLLLLRVSSEGQFQTIKVIKAQ